jgi:hypothetical protein
MHLQNQRLNVVQSRGKFSTSSLATAPEMLASEVTLGLQQEQSPTPISLCHDLFIKRGDRMEVNSKQYCSNSETRPGMHGQVRS